MGMIVVLPLILSATPATMREATGGRNALEFVGIAVAATVVAYGAVSLVAYPFVLVALALAAAAMRLNPFATAVVSALGLLAVVVAGLAGDARSVSGESAFMANGFHVFAALSIVLPFAISLLVTQLRGDRARIAESEERFRSAMEYSAIGMALVGLDGRWLRINPAVCELLGYSWEELQTLTFQELTHPDDVDTDLDLARSAASPARSTPTGWRSAISARTARSSGRCWRSQSCATSRPAPLYFISQIEDITARKEADAKLAASESRWSFALDGARQGVWDVDMVSQRRPTSRRCGRR